MPFYSDPEREAAYDKGFDRGESSCNATYAVVLDDLLPFEFDGPNDLAKKLAAFLKDVEKIGYDAAYRKVCPDAGTIINIRLGEGV